MGFLPPNNVGAGGGGSQPTVTTGQTNQVTVSSSSTIDVSNDTDYVYTGSTDSTLRLNTASLSDDREFKVYFNNRCTLEIYEDATEIQSDLQMIEDSYIIIHKSADLVGGYSIRV
ncbi:hypothetical protein [Francisella marina]|uniref:hypothetical protein n=1 Tax=Francisella marina TaxID=2249302 RepID=UPI0011EDCD99|nr:hypothetical protein [Francisella marina]QEO58338.1 hypothetical protein F0R75_00575 [Francisella marina]